MTDLCQWVIHPGRRYGDEPEPPEYCTSAAAEGEKYCTDHLAPAFPDL